MKKSRIPNHDELSVQLAEKFQNINKYKQDNEPTEIEESLTMWLSFGHVSYPISAINIYCNECQIIIGYNMAGSDVDKIVEKFDISGYTYVNNTSEKKFTVYSTSRARDMDINILNI